MSFGVMGGPMQAQGHVQMTLRTQLWGQDPQSAVDAPRWRVTSGVEVAVEATVSAATREALAARGHVISVESPDIAFGFGGAQIVQRIPGGYGRRVRPAQGRASSWLLRAPSPNVGHIAVCAGWCPDGSFELLPCWMLYDATCRLAIHLPVREP